jgi:hypothetical protein
MMGAETLDVVADRGYYDGQEILACEAAGITVTLPKPMTSSAKAARRFGKAGLRLRCGRRCLSLPAGEMLTYRYTNEEDGKTLRRCWTTACQRCGVVVVSRAARAAAMGTGDRFRDSVFFNGLAL